MRNWFGILLLSILSIIGYYYHVDKECEPEPKYAEQIFLRAKCYLTAIRSVFFQYNNQKGEFPDFENGKILLVDEYWGNLLNKSVNNCQYLYKGRHEFQEFLPPFPSIAKATGSNVCVVKSEKEFYSNHDNKYCNGELTLGGYVYFRQKGLIRYNVEVLGEDLRLGDQLSFKELNSRTDFGSLAIDIPSRW